LACVHFARELALNDGFSRLNSSELAAALRWSLDEFRSLANITVTFEVGWGRRVGWGVECGGGGGVWERADTTNHVVFHQSGRPSYSDRWKARGDYW
jgi:hypothetical protein